MKELERSSSLNVNKVLKTTLIKSIERQNSSKHFHFSEHFDIQEQIGRGGTGDVWKARHRGDGSMYAIKVFPYNLAIYWAF